MEDMKGNSVTPQERATAKRTARLMRSARKQLGLTQESVANRLGISQSALSKLEHGILIPSAIQWFEFCHMTGITTESILTGYIERNQLARLEQGLSEGSFKLPKKYARNRGSKVRAVLPILNYLEECLGEKKYRAYLKSTKVDHDFFINLDNQINIQFMLDTTKYLIQQKLLRPKDVQKLTKTVNQPEMHGNLRLRYDRGGDTFSLMEMLFTNSKHYECNFRYQIEDIRAGKHMDISVTPEEHLAETNYLNDEVLGDFIEKYKQSYFERFALYGGRSQKKLADVQVLESLHRADKRYVYRIEEVA